MNSRLGKYRNWPDLPPLVRDQGYVLGYWGMPESSAISAERSGVARILRLSCALVGTFVLAACSGSSAKGASPQEVASIPVKIEVARSVSLSDTSEYVAMLKSRDSAILMPQVEGQITEIRVHSGDRVSPGAVMMQIDPTKQQATVNSQEHNRTAQEANLKWAQSQYEGTSGLYAAGVVSKQDLDQSKSTLDNAQAQVRALDAQVQEQQVQLRYYRVTAPTNGIVGDIP